MRKILLGTLLPLLMLSSCGKDETEPQIDGEGSLTIQTKIINDGIQVIPTRVEADEVDLYITMKNTANSNVFISKKKLSEYADNKIEKIPVGNYEITLTTHPDIFTPAFDAPCYEGINANIRITENSNENVSINCIQKNAGVRFIYDSSLEAVGYSNMYPVITQDNTRLAYSGNQKSGTGYFNAGRVAITFTDSDGAYYAIDGQKEKELTLASEQLWEVTLKADNDVVNSNSIKMTVSIRTVGNPTHNAEYTLYKAKDLFAMKYSFPPAGTMLNVSTNNLMDEMAFTYMEQSLWDKKELTKEQILSSGRKLTSSELTEVNTPAGKYFSVSSFGNIKENVEYYLWMYASKNGKEDIQRSSFKPQSLL